MNRCNSENPSMVGLLCDKQPRLHPDHTAFNGIEFVDWPNELYVKPSDGRKQNKHKLKEMAGRINHNVG